MFHTLHWKEIFEGSPILIAVSEAFVEAELGGGCLGRPNFGQFKGGRLCLCVLFLQTHLSSRFVVFVRTWSDVSRYSIVYCRN